MLRDNGANDVRPSGLRITAFAILLATGIAVAGLRGGDDVTRAIVDTVPEDSTSAGRAITAGWWGSREGIEQLERELRELQKDPRHSKAEANLKRIAIALHHYYQTHKAFPPSVVSDGRSTWSWRVQLLPYLGYGKLFNEYRTSQPWDHPDNLKVLEKMPDVYGHPDQPDDSKGAAYFGLTGRQGVFDSFDTGDARRAAEIEDGLANTIMIVEAQRDVPWTRPEDIVVTDRGSAPDFRGYAKRGFHALFADGSVQFVPHDIDAESLRTVVTRAGGEPNARRNLGR